MIPQRATKYRLLIGANNTSGRVDDRTIREWSGNTFPTRAAREGPSRAPQKVGREQDCQKLD